MYISGWVSLPNQFSFKKSMRNVISGIVQIIVIVLFLGAVFIFSRPPTVEEIQSEESNIGQADLSVRSVLVMRPDIETQRLSLESTGSVVARNIVPLIPQVTGTVLWVSPNLRTGGTFQKNEVLLKIDPADAELLIAQAEANLLVAQANLELREAESQAARENWTLLHEGEVPDLVAKLPQINQAKANIAVANAQLSAAKLDLARTDFSLPFDGRVLASQIGVGQWVSRGQAIGTSFDLNSLEVEVPISGTEQNLLSPVTERDALVFANDEEIPAFVDRMSASADLRSRASSLYLSFPAIPESLVPGNFVSVTVYGREQSNVYRIPEIAEQANSTLWIVRAGLLERVTPQIIERRDEELTIVAFDYGDGIVIGSLVGVYPGQKVAIASE